MAYRFPYTLIRENTAFIIECYHPHIYRSIARDESYIFKRFKVFPIRKVRRIKHIYFIVFKCYSCRVTVGHYHERKILYFRCSTPVVLKPLKDYFFSAAPLNKSVCTSAYGSACKALVAQFFNSAFAYYAKARHRQALQHGTKCLLHAKLHMSVVHHFRMIHSSAITCGKR